MARSNTLIRSLHDVGLAAWFGGSLMGAVGLNGASARVKDPSDRARVASIGWGRWAPVNALAIGVHAVGGIGLIAANKGRVVGQAGARSNTAIKAAITVAAMGATLYSGIQGAKLGKQGSVPAQGATEPSAGTSPDAAAAQKRLQALQWTIPVLTGTLVVMAAQQGEQQKPSQLIRGAVRNVVSAR